ncbi:MAG: hypothetical protein M3082_11960 [Candidatus Dormibacteraeota bacterium]|nr:hypothetical protein [Candidatus Dormibacteraeota bacterium]
MAQSAIVGSSCPVNSRSSPYLVDHAFVPEVWLSFVRSFELGDPDQWLQSSDHVPLVMELDVPASIAPTLNS